MIFFGDFLEETVWPPPSIDFCQPTWKVFFSLLVQAKNRLKREKNTIKKILHVSNEKMLKINKRREGNRKIYIRILYWP